MVRADHLNIDRWQAVPEDLRCHSKWPHSRARALGEVWGIVARLMDWHMNAEQEICAPAMRQIGPPACDRMDDLLEVHEDLREVLAETCLQPPGSPQWWRRAEASRRAWARHADVEEYGILTELLRLPAYQSVQLARQWVAFMNARVLDQFPDAPAGATACRLWRQQTTRILPRRANLCVPPILCTCPACAKALQESLPVLGRFRAAFPARPVPAHSER